jgi:predicted Zn-dependent peptidase
MGAIINAFTSKEATCYYFKVVDKYVKESFSLLSDIFFHSAFVEEEMEKEKNVVIEEINMDEDDPEGISSDLTFRSVFGDRSLGRSIIGTKENVKNFSKNDIKKHISKYYASHNTVISFAGNISFEDAEKLVEDYVLENYPENQPIIQEPIVTFEQSNYLERIKDFEQSNIAIAFPGVSSLDPIRERQVLLSVIFGGGMSSRLFQSIRENKGLAYSVYSTHMTYMRAGYFAVCLNNSLENSEKAVKAVKGEIDLLLKNGINKEEYERAKVQLISSLVFSEENIQSIMFNQGRTLLAKERTEPYSIDERISKIENTSIDDLMDYAKNTFNMDKVYCTYVGKKNNYDLFSILKN